MSEHLKVLIPDYLLLLRDTHISPPPIRFASIQNGNGDPPFRPRPFQLLITSHRQQKPPLVTKETVFYAQGGEQPADTGVTTLNSAEIGDGVVFDMASVRNGEGGKILHLGSFSSSESSEVESVTLPGSRVC
ncbi:hypothetical protein BJX70DRAFT_310732 [Aspergillus crustosus]